MNEKFNIFNLPPKDLSNEPEVIECENISKGFFPFNFSARNPSSLWSNGKTRQGYSFNGCFSIKKFWLLPHKKVFFIT